MRVTDNMRFSAAAANEARLSQRLYSASKQASTGSAVESPSDSPTKFVAIAAKDSAIARMEWHLDAAKVAQTDIEIAESTLASASQVMVRARELALDMSSGDKSASERSVAAKEVDEIRNTLITLGNTRGSHGFLFGGTRTDAPPFTAAGVFAGNDGVIPVEIADGATVAANPSGARAFTAAGGRDLLADLADLAKALATNDVAAIQAQINPMEEGHRQLVGARSDAGLTIERLSSAQDVGTSALLTLRTARSRDADVDPVAAYTELSAAQTAYEQNLAVTKQILSLMAKVSQ